MRNNNLRRMVDDRWLKELARMDYAGIQGEARMNAILSLDKIKKIGEEAVKKEMRSKDIAEDAIEKLMNAANLLGKNGEIFFKRRMFLDNPDKELGLDESYMAYMPEYDSRAYADAELFDIECTVRRFKGRSIIQIRTIAPAKYILNTSGDDRVTDFSPVHDPSFEKLVSAGIVVETVFISPMDKKVARWIVAYMDMEPEEKGQRVMGNDILSFDIRDLMPDRHTRKVERKPDGSLIVSDGRLINQREFVWDAVRIVEPAKA